MTEPASKLRRILARAFWLLLVLLVLDQVALYLLVDEDRIFGYPLLPYFPPEFELETPDSHPPLVADAEFGWRLATRLEGGTIDLDWTGGRLGSRSLPPRKQPGTRRILLLGGSISLGSELANGEPYPARLDASEAQCEVVNLSTPLVGIDQSLLRLRAEGLKLAPDEVWLAFEPSAALIATTRYLPLVRRAAGEVLSKPRFRLGDESELTLLPGLMADDLRALLIDEARYRDEFAPTEMWASRRGSLEIPGFGERFFLTKFGASLALARGLEQDRRLRRTGSEAFRTLVAIALEFEREVTLAGARLRVLILPATAPTSGSEPGHTLFADELRSYGMEVLECEPSSDGWSPKAHREVGDDLAAILELDD